MRLECAIGFRQLRTCRRTRPGQLCANIGDIRSNSGHLFDNRQRCSVAFGSRGRLGFRQSWEIMIDWHEAHHAGRSTIARWRGPASWRNRRHWPSGESRSAKQCRNRAPKDHRADPWCLGRELVHRRRVGRILKATGHERLAHRPLTEARASVHDRVEHGGRPAMARMFGTSVSVIESAQIALII